MLGQWLLTYLTVLCRFRAWFGLWGQCPKAMASFITRLITPRLRMVVTFELRWSIARSTERQSSL